MGCILIPVRNRELALRGRADLADPAFGVLGELLGCGPCVLSGLSDHFRLYVVESVEGEYGLELVIITGYSHAFFKQVSLPAHQAAHQVYLVGGHGHHRYRLVTIGVQLRF